MSRSRSFTAMMAILLCSMMIAGCGSSQKGAQPPSASPSDGGTHTMPDGSKMNDKEMKK